MIDLFVSLLKAIPRDRVAEDTVLATVDATCPHCAAPRRMTVHPYRTLQPRLVRLLPPHVFLCSYCRKFSVHEPLAIRWLAFLLVVLPVSLVAACFAAVGAWLVWGVLSTDEANGDGRLALVLAFGVLSSSLFGLWHAFGSGRRLLDRRHLIPVSVGPRGLDARGGHVH